MQRVWSVCLKVQFIFIGETLADWLSTNTHLHSIIPSSHPLNAVLLEAFWRNALLDLHPTRSVKGYQWYFFVSCDITRVFLQSCMCSSAHLSASEGNKGIRGLTFPFSSLWSSLKECRRFKLCHVTYSMYNVPQPEFVVASFFHMDEQIQHFGTKKRHISDNIKFLFLYLMANLIDRR